MPVDSLDDDFATRHGTVVDRTSNFVWKILNMIPVVYLVRGPDARIPTATVQQHVFHILCRWQESKKSEQRMPIEHGNTAHTWHIPGLSLQGFFLGHIFWPVLFRKRCHGSSQFPERLASPGATALPEEGASRCPVGETGAATFVPDSYPDLFGILVHNLIIYTLIYTLIYT